VVLSYLPAVYLARLLPLHEHGTPLYWTFIAATSIVLAFVARAVGRRRPDDALLAVLGVIVGVLVLDVMTGARLQLSSAFGYTATIGIRVSGFGNIAYAALGASAIVVSGLVAHRLGGRRGAVVASLVMIVALLADVAPFWGSDVGGVVSLVPAFGVTAAMLFRLRVRLTWRLVAIVTVGSAAALALLTGFDLARPADARTHLGRLAQQVLDQGFSPLANTITRKVDANLDTWSSSDWRLILLPSVLFLGYLAVFERGRVRALVSAVPETRAVLAGIGVLAVLGYAFNDSGVTVPAVVLAVTSVSLVVLLAVHGGDQPTRAPEWLVRRRVRVTPAPLR
jgi:hypothetical protein